MIWRVCDNQNGVNQDVAKNGTTVSLCVLQIIIILLVEGSWKNIQ
jgi:hypothetical protein